MNILIIKHRCNSIADLATTPPHLGVEVDIRSHGESLILAHDPFSPGEEFREWIGHYRHRFVVLNLKEEGLEDMVLSILKRHGVEDFFFLDQSFPFLLKTALAGERRCAVRASEYESVDTALSVARLVDWVWIDTFTRLALTGRQARNLKEAGLKLCLVSPELVGRSAEDGIRLLQQEMLSKDIPVDAVCTKNPETWAQWSPPA